MSFRGEGVGPALKGVCRGYGARGPCSGDESMIRFIFLKMQGNEMGYPKLSTGFIAWRMCGAGQGQHELRDRRNVPAAALWSPFVLATAERHEIAHVPLGLIREGRIYLGIRPCRHW